ncbi:hypothetical protein [Amycolatopsis silviterrae]|uniref:Transmembrane protein n=1 Tax=Amycolatopsis silviterrae TaxID=1656914 RepID=A0ABW5H330_9PSEU
MRSRIEWRLACGCVFLLGTLGPALPVRLFALVAALATGAVVVCAIRPGHPPRRARRRLLAAAAAGMLGMLLGWLVHAGGLVASAAGLLIVLSLCSWTVRYTAARKRAIPRPREYVSPPDDLMRARRTGAPPSRSRYPDGRERAS